MSAGTNRIITPLILAFVLLTSTPTFAGKIIYVDDDTPADFNNIQAAIDNANDYDEIEVSPGTYNEAIDFKGKAVRLYSSGGPEVTTIDANGITGVYHVVQCVSSEDANTVLEGFTITGGDANGPAGEDRHGGGMYNYFSSPTVTNCTFTGNSAYMGGGMCNDGSSPIVTNCTFSGNWTDTGYGRGDGGGMFNWRSNPKVINCTFTGNTAGQNGGGIGSFESYPFVINCILWGDKPNEILHIGFSLTLTFSDVQGGTGKSWFGNGCIDADPCFVDPGYWDPNGTPEDANDDFFVSGDYHLKSQAGRYDPITQTWVYDTVTSPCIDAGDQCSDWSGELWPHGKRINIGAYGGTAEASMSLSDAGNIADLNNDGFVDLADLLFDKWLCEEVLLPEDLNRDGIFNFLDYAIFANDYLEPPPLPGQASNPNPANGATGMNRNADLSWTAGSDAMSHDVYFGASNPPPFIGNQTSTAFDPGTMASNATYYWRIDEINSSGITTGIVWSFTTGDGGGKPPGSPPGCFPADTPVWIDGAQVQISKVAAGRKVDRLDPTYAVSGFKKPVCLKEIESVLEYQGTDDYYNIVLENGNRINVVHSHYFLTASDRWVLVENLKVGSKLQSLMGPISIRTIEKREVPFTGRFYNLKIKGGDRYFVGKDGVVVRSH